MVPGLDPYYTYPAQRIRTAGEELDDLDHDLSDLSEVWTISIVVPPLNLCHPSLHTSPGLFVRGRFYRNPSLVSRPSFFLELERLIHRLRKRTWKPATPYFRGTLARLWPQSWPSRYWPIYSTCHRPSAENVTAERNHGQNGNEFMSNGRERDGRKCSGRKRNGRENKGQAEK